MKNLNLFSLFFILIISIKVNSQEANITAGIGLQGLEFKPINGKNSIKSGFRIGMGYTYFINDNWGIITGAELSSYQNQTDLEDKIYTSNQIDSEGEAFEYRVGAKGYKEKNRFLAVSIPLMIQYRTGDNLKFYISGGGKIGFPFSQKTEASAQSLILSGYYPSMNAEYTDLPQHGFGTINNWNGSKKGKLQNSFMLSAETGVSFMISKKSKIYTGFYLDYGLNSMVKQPDSIEENPLVTYSSNGINNIRSNGILVMKDGIDKARLIAYGILLRYTFGGFKEKKQNKD